MSRLRRRRSLDNLPLILVAAIFWAGGAWRVIAAHGPDTLSAALLSAGCIVLGAWLVDLVTDNSESRTEDKDKKDDWPSRDQ